MSKEIIIDGVNVAECSLYNNGNCLKYMTDKNSMEDVKCNSMCDYGAYARQEQLQRAKAEKQEKVLKMAEAEVEIEKLQTENEKLKVELEQYKKSKQASYESMRTKWIFATDTLRNVDVENEKLKEIIKQAIKDFNHEIGTPYYDKLCENAIKLKIRGSIDE